MRVFVTGVKGQLGYDVMNELEKQGLEGIGVRISLDEDMFETYDVGTVNRSFYNNREYCFENFVVSSYINKVGLVDVKYEQNIELYYKEAIKCFDQGVAFKHDNIGIYK